MSEKEAFSEELCLFRKYAFEFGQSNDMEAYELMMKCQVNLHAPYKVSARDYNFMKDLAIGTEKLNLELKADNERLREALSSLYPGLVLDLRYADKVDDDLDAMQSRIDTVQQALSATPAQSLQAHDNEVIEKCASVCDEMENEYGWGCVAASTIRLMKGKE